MPTSSVRLAAVLGCLVALGFSACDRSTAPIDARTVATVSVATSRDTIAPDDTLPLTVAVADSAGHAVTAVRTVWSTSDPNVATVDSLGNVHGIAPGVVEISAIASGARGSVSLVVRLRPARLVFSADTLGLGDVVTLSYTILDAAGRTVPYSANLSNSDTTIVAVRAAPIDARTVDVIAEQQGSVTFTAVVEGHPVTEVITVGPQRVIGLGAMQKSVIVPLGTVRPVVAIPYVGGGVPTAVPLQWSSADPTIASVDEAGNVTPHQIGSTIVRATFQAFEADVNVRVFAYPEAPKFTSVVAGDASACALSESGRVYCWGAVTGDDPMPVPMASTETFVSLVSGPSGEACAVATDGSIVCWTPPSPISPIASDVPFATVSRADDHSCALTTAGKAYCWGYDNVSGEQGSGDFVRSMTPVPVVGGLTFSQIAVITAASCGITVDKSLYCWGMRSYPPGGQSPVPVQREAGSVWQSISAGRGERLCGTTTDHTYCWQTIDLGTPLAASRPFVQASGGVAHTCFLDAAGIAYCNGFSAYGAIGNGKIPPYSIGDPVAVTGDLRFKSISAGNDFTCAVTVDGVLYCWGHNGAGRVGAPSITVDMRSLISPSSSVQCKYFVCAIGGIYLTPQKVLGQP